jgi:hypothetical protein
VERTHFWKLKKYQAFYEWGYEKKALKMSTSFGLFTETRILNLLSFWGLDYIFGKQART